MHPRCSYNFLDVPVLVYFGPLTSSWYVKAYSTASKECRYGGTGLLVRSHSAGTCGSVIDIVLVFLSSPASKMN